MENRNFYSVRFAIVTILVFSTLQCLGQAQENILAPPVRTRMQVLMDQGTCQMTTEYCCNNYLGKNNPHQLNQNFPLCLKVAAIFFGCAKLVADPADVVCTNRIQKLTKGVDCNVRAPLGTKATYACTGNKTLSKTYNIIQCKLPGKWVPTPPQCILPSEVQVEEVIVEDPFFIF